MNSFRNTKGHINLCWLLCLIALILAMGRIVTLQVHVNKPRLSNHQNGYYDYEGVIHWHTIYSGDALGSYDALADLGNRCQLDFMVSTEHNNIQALDDHQEGWHGRMLTLVGIEATRKDYCPSEKSQMALERKD